MKKLLIILTLLPVLACKKAKQSKESPLDLMEKRVYQFNEVIGMGLVQDIEIDSISKTSDTTAFARHHFFNTSLDKNIRVSRNYHFNPGLDSVVSREEVMTEMESQGEWVKMP